MVSLDIECDEIEWDIEFDGCQHENMVDWSDCPFKLCMDCNYIEFVEENTLEGLNPLTTCCACDRKDTCPIKYSVINRLIDKMELRYKCQI